MTVTWEGRAKEISYGERLMTQYPAGTPTLFGEERTVGQLASAKAALTYILAGNAYFTLRSKKTGTRYTYRVNRPKATADKIMHFVSLLSGPDNTQDYTYLGVIRPGNRFQLTTASKMTLTSTPVKAVSWALSSGTGLSPSHCRLY